ncbi:conjugal transfer protein TraR [Pseudoalteromonas fenneropenaei]|uniref:Conjugal transfer protein TraR n=1 Tax=Pseudoalteromonas fenneropenaei TaxID=1737459 RepID=A0ABV7CIB1_9GAMM
MKENQTLIYKRKLELELDCLRQAFLNELKRSDNSFMSALVSALEQAPPTEWLDMAANKLSPEHLPRYNRLVQLEAALCQIDIGQYGYCCDCEQEIDSSLLSEDAATQRCGGCMTKKVANHI